jgi:hypothetical protein
MAADKATEARRDEARHELLVRDAHVVSGALEIPLRLRVY